MNKDCTHKELFWGSGDYYLVCSNCGCYWKMQDQFESNANPEAAGLSGSKMVSLDEVIDQLKGK